jgi:hypothetical protein
VEIALQDRGGLEGSLHPRIGLQRGKSGLEQLDQLRQRAGLLQVVTQEIEGFARARSGLSHHPPQLLGGPVSSQALGVDPGQTHPVIGGQIGVQALRDHSLVQCRQLGPGPQRGRHPLEVVGEAFDLGRGSARFQ